MFVLGGGSNLLVGDRGIRGVVLTLNGELAALTFRLVARNPDGTTDTYRNSGTFVLRDNRWQVITWQATKVPPAAMK